MKITFECKEILYRLLCDFEEYCQITQREPKVESFDRVIQILIDQGFEYLCLYKEPEFEIWRARQQGGEASVDEDGNLHLFFPEEPKEE